jgi:hypothetical protein
VRTRPRTAIRRSSAGFCVKSFPFSEGVRRLIVDAITSVEQLEILLLLREESERSWTAEQVDDHIKSNLSSVAARLSDLHSHRFLRRDEQGGYWYDPGPERVPVIDELAAAYSERRYSVIELIFSKPSDKLEVFAQAFRIRKDDDG